MFLCWCFLYTHVGVSSLGGHKGAFLAFVCVRVSMQRALRWFRIFGLSRHVLVLPPRYAMGKKKKQEDVDEHRKAYPLYGMWAA